MHDTRAKVKNSLIQGAVAIAKSYSTPITQSEKFLQQDYHV